MNLAAKIESLLLISIRPISVKELMERLEVKKKEEIEAAIEILMQKYNVEGSGIAIQKIEDKIQMVTSATNAQMVSDYLKEEVSGELTPASLETLTVIAYRGPITKPELELIRGVNCSLILRNLLIRGLVEEKKGSKDLVPSYQITFEFLRYLGLSEVKELPDFEKLNSDENLKNLLNQSQQPETEVEALEQPVEQLVEQPPVEESPVEEK